jgi:hypothetical protein
VERKPWRGSDRKSRIGMSERKKERKNWLIVVNQVKEIWDRLKEVIGAE